MIGLDLSTNGKLVVIWIMRECNYVANLVLESAWIISPFYFKSIIVHLEFLFFFFLHCMFFKTFYQRMNKPKYAITSFAIFQVSEIGLTTFLTQLVSILTAKLQKVVIRGKIMFLNFRTFFLKTYIVMVVTFFFGLVVIQSTKFFSGTTYL